MSYGISDIRELSKKYDFTFSIIEFLADTYGLKRAEEIIKSLKKPVKNYAIRVNTLKTNQTDLIEKLRLANIEANPHPIFKDIISFKVKGPLEVASSEKYVIADKFRR